MQNIDYKLICWGDFSIPVSINYKWMAFDKFGQVWVYTHEPSQVTDFWQSHDYDIEATSFRLTQIHIPPPEEGDWTEQLYWIGD